MSETRFESQVALVSGGANGIGAATARLLRQQGANVVIGDLPGVGGEALAQEIGATYEPLDVTREEDWRRVVGTILHQHGALHILVNAAGIVGDGVADGFVTATFANLAAGDYSVWVAGANYAAQQVEGPSIFPTYGVSVTVGVVPAPAAAAMLGLAGFLKRRRHA